MNLWWTPDGLTAELCEVTFRFQDFDLIQPDIWTPRGIVSGSYMQRWATGISS